MSTAVAILISLGVAFGGGFWLGTAKEKARTSVLIEQSKIEIDKVSLKLDSLKNVPAKIDTVIEIQKVIEFKTDTLILMNKDIYQNTDTIKKELRQFIKEGKSDEKNQ